MGSEEGCCGDSAEGFSRAGLSTFLCDGMLAELMKWPASVAHEAFAVIGNRDHLRPAGRFVEKRSVEEAAEFVRDTARGNHTAEKRFEPALGADPAQF